MREFLHNFYNLLQYYADFTTKSRTFSVFVKNNHEIIFLPTCILYAISVIKWLRKPNLSVTISASNF